MESINNRTMLEEIIDERQNEPRQRDRSDCDLKVGYISGKKQFTPSSMVQRPRDLRNRGHMISRGEMGLESWSSGAIGERNNPRGSSEAEIYNISILAPSPFPLIAILSLSVLTYLAGASRESVDRV